jgi:hypothetical protein
MGGMSTSSNSSTNDAATSQNLGPAGTVGRVTLTRRSMLAAMGAMGAVGATGATALFGGSPRSGAQTSDGSAGMFPDGLMSGDPQPGGAVLWTPS